MSDARPIAPATFCGMQSMDEAGREWLELWTLTADIPGHPCRSGVTRETLEAAGYAVPPRPTNGHGGTP